MTPRVRPWKMLVISLLLNVLLFGGLYILFRGNKSLNDSIHATRDALLTELNGMKKSYADNGSEIASIRSQMVTVEMIRRMDSRLVKRLNDMDISVKELKKQVTDITLLNTVTEYHIKDSTIVVTDTSFSSQYKEYPWIDFRSTVYPELGYSESSIMLYDSLAIVGKMVRDTTYGWIKRAFKPKVAEVTINNYNPYSRVAYIRQLKIDK